MTRRWAGLTAFLVVLALAGPAWAQCTVFKVFSFQERLTSSDLNASFQRTVDANVPTCVDDYSASVTQMRAMTDPFPSSNPSLATTLAGELERLRFQVDALVGKTFWYETADNSLARGVAKHWGATFTKFSEIADPASPPVNELALYAKDDGAGVTVLAYRDSAGTVNTLTGPSTSFGNAVTVNLRVARNTGAPTTRLDVSADRISVQGRIKATLAVTINAATTGANALDAGTLAASTLYYVWVVVNVTSGDFAAIASTSETAPTMPVGYTLKRNIGAFRTGATSQWIDGVQLDNVFMYAAPQVVVTAGAAATATAIDLATFVPNTTTRAVYVTADMDSQVQLNWTTFTVGPANVHAGCCADVATFGGPMRVPTLGTTRSTIYYAKIGAGTADIYLTGWETVWKE